MANEIVVQNLGTGKDGYFQVRQADLTIFNGTTFEAYNAPDWATQYARGKAAADAAGDYKADFPALAAGYYFYKVFSCANGGTAASTDDLVEWGSFYWNGTARIDRLSGVVVQSLLANVITAAAIQNDAITALKLADGAITSAKIADTALTHAKIADDAREGIRDSVWAKAMTELTTIPAVTASIFDAIRWCFTRLRNKRTQNTTTETLMRDDGTTPLATSTTTDTGGVFTAGKWS
jgi:hypothetical protein